MKDEEITPKKYIQNVERDVKNDELGLTLNEFLASGITDELAYFYNEIYSKCRNKDFHRMACIWDCDDWGGNLFQGLAKNEFVNNGY